MKIIFIIFFVSFIWGRTNAQNKKSDSIAILIFDRMASVLGELESCSFKVSVLNDIQHHYYGRIKNFSESTIFLSGSNKLLIDEHNTIGHRQILYNGEQIVIYSFNENNYGFLPAATSTLNTIDSISETFGIEFPAADFFYPAFTQDLLMDSDSIKFLGMVRMNEKELFHLISYGKDKLMEFWINNDAFCLPLKFAITYLNNPQNLQYFATFSDWQINPKIPDIVYDFIPPPNSSKIRILAKNEY